ncbi:MAG: deoxyribodipyrimidine photo-lyase [Rhodospirillales bacterium]|nr:deoxyribodipyrimidine photo-lyase [Rhodospirillales bacterium]
MTPASIVWFRQDLRLQDHPALDAAIKQGGPVVPLYIWAPDEEDQGGPGGTSRWWLHHSLASLDGSLRKMNSCLIVRRGQSLATLKRLIRETGAKSVFWNRCYEPMIADRDKRIESELAKDGVTVRIFNGSLFHEPEAIKTKVGEPYKVFTPFWRACLSLGDPAEPLPAPRKISAPMTWPGSESLESLGLLPKVDRPGGIRRAWEPSEKGAAREMKRFLAESVMDYASGRDRPDRQGTSHLSPYLHHGEISPRQVWHAVMRHEQLDNQPGMIRGSQAYLRQIYWREFAYHLLHHFPHTVSRPLREVFMGFPWRMDRKGLRAWKQGRTGYPAVDAAMRELWSTGWMHNRMRMVVASFLTKDLLIDWREGARWFWDTLVDADLANNTFGWQWTAGCGADAAPFFRIFNPVMQGEKFDPEGRYVRRWIPELRELPDRFIHKPWEAPDDMMQAAGVSLGETYPKRTVDHKVAKYRALDGYQRIKMK